MSAYRLSVHDLEFRAACNAAVAESKRPLRRRVMERLAASPDTHGLISGLLPRVSLAPGGGLFELLAKEPQWQTLVAETAADTLEWNDLAERGVAFGERLHAVWRKFSQGDDQKALRYVVATVCSVVFAGSVDRATDGKVHEMVASIRTTLIGPPAPMDVKFQLSAEGTAIPVSFVPVTEAASIPIKLDVQAQPRPIVVDIAAAGYTKELAEVLHQLTQANLALADLAKKSGADASQFAKLGKMESHLRRVVDLQTNMVEAGAGQRYDVTLDEDHPQTLLLQSLDPATGNYRAVDVVMCLEAVDKPNGPASARYSIGSADKAGGCSGGQWIFEGKPQAKKTDVGDWMVAVRSVKRRLNGQGRATFSLRPDVPQLRKLVAADTTD